MAFFERVETSSRPQALFAFRDFSILATSLGVQIRSLAHSEGKIARTKCDSFLFCFLLVERLARDFETNH